MNFNLEGIESNVAYAWDNNIGTYNLANSKGPLISPRTKHIGVKYHWLRFNILPKKIVVKKIETKKQRADFFTKVLTKFDFGYLRSFIMRW